MNIMFKKFPILNWRTLECFQTLFVKLEQLIKRGLVTIKIVTKLTNIIHVITDLAIVKLFFCIYNVIPIFIK